MASYVSVSLLVVELVDVPVEPGSVEEAVAVEAAGLQPAEQSRDGKEEVEVAVVVQTVVDGAIVPVQNPAGHKTRQT